MIQGAVQYDPRLGPVDPSRLVRMPQQNGQEQPPDGVPLMPPTAAPPTGGQPGIPGQMQGQRIDPRSFSEIPNIGGSDEARTRIEQAMMARSRALLDPAFADQERAMQGRLANRGLAAGSEAFDRELTQFNDARNRAYSDAANQAVMAGSQEAQRLFGNQLSYDQLASAERIAQLQRDAAAGNAAAQMQLQQMQLQYNMSAQELEASFRQQAFDSQQAQQQFDNQFRLMSYGDQASLADRQQFFNELQYFLGGGMGQSYPQIGQPQAYVPNVGNAFGNYDAQRMSAWQQNQSNTMGTINNLAQIGATLFMGSHSDLKTDIAEPQANLADAIERIDVKQWRYKDEPETLRFGPMAEQAPAEFSDGRRINLGNVIFGLVEAVQQISKRLTAIEESRNVQPATV